MREISYNKDYVKLDGGFYFAQGVFETILIKEEAVFLEEHIKRLNKSIDIMGLGENIDIEFIKNFIKQEKLKNIVLKIVVTEKNIVFSTRKIKYSKEDYKNGFKLKLSSVLRNPTSMMTYLRALSYNENLYEYNKANKEGFNEVVFLNIYGKGVIIKGDSGIGKSEIALELIKRGHQLIADDAVELYHIGQSIIGKAPTVLKNLLEIRGIGVIDASKMFGAASVLPKEKVDLIIQLERWLPSREYRRIGVEEDDVTEDILSVPIPKIVVPVTGGRSMSVIIEAAVMNMQLKDSGFDSSKEFVNRILENIKSKQV